MIFIQNVSAVEVSDPKGFDVEYGKASFFSPENVGGVNEIDDTVELSLTRIEVQVIFTGDLYVAIPTNGNGVLDSIFRYNKRLKRMFIDEVKARKSAQQLYSGKVEDLMNVKTMPFFKRLLFLFSPKRVSDSILNRGLKVD